jgi:ribose transport system permease protein
MKTAQRHPDWSPQTTFSSPAVSALTTFRSHAGKYGIAYMLLAIVLFFSVLRPSTYPTLGNFGSVLQANSSIALLALGFMIPLIVGRFDLSIAAVAASSGLLAAGLMSRGIITQWPLAVACVVGLAALMGLVNGYLVAYLKLNSLVVTLCTQSVLAGFVLFYSEGNVIFSGIPEQFLAIGQSRFYGVPLPFLIVLAVAVALWFVLYYRPIGREIYAIGASEDAARLIGIRVDGLTTIAFVASAVLASLGGCIQTAQVGSAAPTAGAEYLLPAIAACFLGETSVRRGFYNVWGTFIAVFLVAAGTSGLYMLGAQAWVQPVFNGVVLVGAVVAAKLGSAARTTSGT